MGEPAMVDIERAIEELRQELDEITAFIEILEVLAERQSQSRSRRRGRQTGTRTKSRRETPEEAHNSRMA